MYDGGWLAALANGSVRLVFSGSFMNFSLFSLTWLDANRKGFHMKLSVHASDSVTVTKGGKGAPMVTLVRGEFYFGNELGGTTMVPMRIASMVRDEKLESLFSMIDGWARYNGGKSSLSPQVSEETVDAIKTIVDSNLDKLFSETDDAGQDTWIDYELTSEGLTETGRRTRKVVSEQTAAKLAGKMDDVMKKAQEWQANAAKKAADEAAPQGKMTLKELRDAKKNG